MCAGAVCWVINPHDIKYFLAQGITSRRLQWVSEKEFVEVDLDVEMRFFKFGILAF